MKLKQYKSIILLSVILIFGMSCSMNSNSQQMETDSGITYQFVNNGSGEIPPDGGFWMMNIAYYNDKGDTLFSSNNQGGAMPMNYMAAQFTKNASIEECFSLIGEGDSAVFYISADSLYKNSSGRPAPPDLVGTKIKLCIGIDQVFTTEEFSAYSAEMEQVQIAKEKESIQAYLIEKGITAEVTREGLYYEITQSGNGVKPQIGQKVRVNYTGYTMEGIVFDTSFEEIAKEANIYSPGRPYEPIAFAIGTGAVIQGWDIGLGLLDEGGKATLVIPSPLAYGNRGAGALVKANSTLVFTVELVEIVE